VACGGAWKDEAMKRFAGIAVALVLALAACGQFEGVHEKAVNIAPGAGGGTTGAAATTGGEAPAGGTTTGAAAGGTTTGAAAPGQSTTTGGGTQTTTGGGGSSPPPAVKGGDTTGVTPTQITIGIHAPLTGAAPLRASSFDVGKDLYWEKGDNGKPISVFGRRVKVIFQDDQYNPSHARLVCQNMAEGQKSFLLIGGAGTDQIQACAQYAASRGIPYLSPGTTENQLRSLQNYYAFTMSYAQQAPLLSQYIKNVLKVTDNKRIATVITNTANFDDFKDALVKAIPGITVFRNDKNERGSSRASSLCTGTVKNFDIVVTPNAPAYYLEMAGAAKCNPQYVGPGVTNGIDEVADLGCKSGQSTVNARFFMPSPSFQDAKAGKWDPSFLKAGGGSQDDIVWLLWGLSKTVHQMLLKAGKDLSREQFIAASQNASYHTGVFPDVTFTSSNHFGAKQVHVLKNVCQGTSGGFYMTEAAFKSSF
jgi:branched-chain amino acid transport system substrate-binding protein